MALPSLEVGWGRGPQGPTGVFEPLKDPAYFARVPASSPSPGRSRRRRGPPGRGQGHLGRRPAACRSRGSTSWPWRTSGYCSFWSAQRSLASAGPAAAERRRRLLPQLHRARPLLGPNAMHLSAPGCSRPGLLPPRPAIRPAPVRSFLYANWCSGRSTCLTRRRQAHRCRWSRLQRSRSGSCSCASGR